MKGDSIRDAYHLVGKEECVDIWLQSCNEVGDWRKELQWYKRGILGADQGQESDFIILKYFPELGLYCQENVLMGVEMVPSL